MSAAGQKIIIAGGGTGGHLFPALAIGTRLLEREPTTQIHYIGSRFGLEATILPNRKLHHTLLSIRGIQRGIDVTSLGRNLLFPSRLIASYRKASNLIKVLHPMVVVGTGGYASGMPLLAAVRNRIPTLIQEQNSYPGITTQKLAQKVNCVCLAFPETVKHLQSTNTVITGNPVRKSIIKGDPKQGAEIFNLDQKKTTVFLFGGSQGSAALNKVMASAVKQLTTAGIQIIWQTGTNQYRSFQHYDNQQVRVLPFVDQMEHAYALSQLIIARAGALTLAEITVCGKPAILIPLPTAAADHQTWNARSLESAGAARLIPEKTLSADILSKEILDLIADPDRLDKMVVEARHLARPDAADLIVDQILELAQA